MEPSLGMSHGALRALARRSGWDDISGPRPRGFGEDSVLVFVARIELVPPS